MRRRDETVSRRRESYHVSAPGQKANGKGYSDSSLALIAAQIRLEKGIGSSGLPDHQKGKTALHVTRQSLFGPSVLLYRVIREESGAVLTFTVEKED
jgi:hypothetical protein